MPAFQGLIAAPFTPMLPDGSINLEIIPSYAESLVRNGVSGVYICGSTGESASLTLEEKKSIIHAWKASLPPELKLMANIGDTHIAHAKELMQFCHEQALAGVGVVGPYYFKPSNVEILVDYCAEIAATVPDMPFYYYHIPVLTGVDFSMIDFLALSSKRIPNLVGIKYTDENLMDFAQCVQFEGGKYEMLWGRDEILLSALVLGASGAVGSTYNYMTPLYLSLIEAMQAGNLELAQKLQYKSIDFIELLGKYGGGGTGKAFMKLCGLDCGAFRKPIFNPTEEQYLSLKADLDRLGFWAYAHK